jgi:xylan 1,4-beta-xylosidase
MMWSGTREQYFELYETTAKAIKAYDPTLRVGGPAATDPDGPWVDDFLKHCKSHQVPLDFYSWHLYRGTPKAVMDAAATARKTLDDAGFKDTESHLNEWRYWTTWEWLRAKDPTKYPQVKTKFAETVSAEGAGFAATVLLALQDSRVDVANFYAADTSPWSMFDGYGIPSKTYFAFKAFNELTKTPIRVTTAGPYRHGVTAGAGMTADKKSATVLVACFKSAGDPMTLAVKGLPWGDTANATILTLDAANDLHVTAVVTLGKDGTVQWVPPKNGVSLLRLSP